MDIANSIGSMDIAGSADSAKYMQAMLDSMVEVSLYTEKTGDTLAKTNDQLNSMAQANQKSLDAMAMYNTLMMAANTTTREMLNSNRELTGILSEHIAKKNELIQKDQEQARIASDRKKQEQEEATRVASIQGTAATATKAISDPSSLISSGLKMLGPEVAAIAAVTGAAAKAVYGTYRDYEKMERAGGAEGQISMGDSLNIGWTAKMNKMFLGVDEAETRKAVSTLTSIGGIRGDQLGKSLDGLAERAEKAGMSVGELAAQEANLIRLRNSGGGMLDAAGSAERVKEITNQAEYIQNTEKLDVSFTKDVMALTAQIAPYVKDKSGKRQDVGDTGDMVVSMLQVALQKQVYSGNFKKEDLYKYIMEGVTQGRDLGDISKSIPEMAKGAGDKTTGDVARFAEKLVPNLLKSSNSYSEAHKKAVEAVSGFTEGVMNGAYDVGILTSSIDDLTLRLKQSPKEAQDFAIEFSKLGKKLDFDGNIFAGAARKIGTDMLAIHGNADAAYKEGTEVVTNFSKEIAAGQLSEADLIKTHQQLRTTYDMSQKGSEGFIKSMLSIQGVTDVAATKLTGWSLEIANSLTPYMSQTEAVTMGTKSMLTFGRLIEEHKVSIADVTSITKTQRDVYMSSGAQVSDMLVGLSHVIESTNVRFEELTGFLTNSAKTMNFYGREQTEGVAMFMSFNKYMKDGTLAVDSFNELLKGPAGASEGMRAMMHQSLIGTGGELGAAFDKAGVGAGIDILLPDIMHAASGGKVSGALESAFGKGKSKDFYKGMAEKITGAQRDMIMEMVGGAAGTTDVNDPQFQYILSKMGPAIGTTIKGVGEGRETGMGFLTSGKLPTMDAKSSEKDLATAYSSFGKSTSNFEKAVNKLLKGAETGAVVITNENAPVKRNAKIK